MNVGEGSCVLDIGCGAGDDVLALGQIVGSKGRVVGIDNSETMIAIPFSYVFSKKDFADNDLMAERI